VTSAAMLLESMKGRFAGIEQADSIAIDPHKWFFNQAYLCKTSARPGFGQRNGKRLEDNSWIAVGLGVVLLAAFSGIDVPVHNKPRS
jgi:hypothetical protein